MPDSRLDDFLSAIHSAHEHGDPQLCTELQGRFDQLLLQCDGLPGGLGQLLESLVWDLVPGDWALWMEMARKHRVMH